MNHERLEYIRICRQLGMSYRRIGKKLDLSAGRVGQIVKRMENRGYPPPRSPDPDGEIRGAAHEVITSRYHAITWGFLDALVGIAER